MIGNRTLGLLFALLGCSCAATSSDAVAGSGSHLEGDDYDAEVPLVPFSDTLSCWIDSGTPVSGTLKCDVNSAGQSAFDTLADGIDVEVTSLADGTRLASSRLPLSVKLTFNQLPVRVRASFSNPKYGADLATSYEIPSFGNNPNALVTRTMPLAFYRAYVITDSASVSYSVGATGDVTPWTIGGQSQSTLSLSGTKSPKNGSVFLPAFVPASGGTVTATLEAGGVKLDGIQLSRPGYFLLKDGALVPAKASDLENAHISDPHVASLHAQRQADEKAALARKDENTAICGKLAAACQLDVADCTSKIEHLTEARRDALISGSAPCDRSTCAGVAACLAP